MLLPIGMDGSQGVVKDLRPYALAPNAWSDIRNMRGINGKFSKYPGLSVVDSSPAFQPTFLTLHQYQGTNFWVYAGLAAVEAFTDQAEGDITRAAGAYTGGPFNRWNSCTINGLLVLNNGVEAPQLWSPPSLAQVLVALTNFPASTTAKVVRAFGKYLVALNVTKSSTNYPTMVKWSHSTDSGVPSSWDETDATKDAGEINLWDSPDQVVDCMPLGSVNIIYKEASTHAMRFIGGTLKFGFPRISSQSGIMGQYCSTVLPGLKHFVFTRDDCVVHDGSTFVSVIDKINRSYWFGNLDPNAPLASFVVHNEAKAEVWVCAPAFGTGTINTVLVWNYRQNTWSLRDVPGLRDVAHAIPAVTSTGDSWDGDTVTAWSTESVEVWDDPKYLTSTPKIRFASYDSDALYELDEDSYQDAGVSYRSYLERTGYSIVGQTDKGELTSDATRVKHLQAVWPRIEADAGTTIDIYVEAQMRQEDTISWSGPYTFTVGTDDKVNVNVTGRFLGVRFEETSDVAWALHSFELEISVLGEH